MRVVCFGPPGTGKTTWARDIVEEYQKQGTPTDQIAYMAFTKAASLEAAHRCGIGEEESRELWFRTIHSACYRLLGDRSDRPKLIKPAQFKKFAQEYGLDVSDQADRMDEESMENLYIGAVSGERNDDRYMKIYNLSRLCCRTVADLAEAKKTQHPRTANLTSVNPIAYRKFVEIYEEFKSKEGVIDFIDMLSRVLEGDCLPAPEFQVAVVDEAQDLGPLTWSVCERILFPATDLFLVGDDDQALYQFAGATADDFLRYRDGAKVHQLKQTHRFGKAIVDLSQQVVHRLSHRQEKQVIPLAGVDHRIDIEYEFDVEAFAKLADGEPRKSGAILHRHVAGCRAIGKRLIQAGIPFINERGVNPLGQTTERDGYMAWRGLCNTGTINQQALVSLLEVVPSRKLVGDEETVTLVHHGAKKKTRDATLGSEEERVYQASDLTGVFSPIFLTAVAQKDPVWLDVRYREYYDALIEKNYDLVKDRPSIRVSTIHGYKGREAETVALFSEMYPKLCTQEDEHRVAYVGLTRTRKNLVICHEQVVEDWTRLYPYPEEVKEMR
jgi:superfamily I DNA/RNA helicase